MRIALSGPAGSGKSTLASALAEDLKLTVADEDMAALVHHHHAFQMARNLSQAMGPANAQAGQVRINKALRQWIESYEAWYAKRAAFCRHHPDFVADRWEADILANWLMSLSGKAEQGETKRFYEAMASSAQQFDLVVLLSPGTHQSAIKNEAGLKRANDVVTQHLGYSLLRGLISETGVSPLILSGDSSVAERVTLVRAALSGG